MERVRNQNTIYNLWKLSFICLGLCSCAMPYPEVQIKDEAFLKKYPTIHKFGKSYKVVPSEDILMRTFVPPPPAPNNEETSIRVNPQAQRAWLYKSGQLVLTSAICPGKEGYETPTGEFRVISKHRDWVSTLYGVPMPYFLRLNACGGQVGLHAGPIALNPASHGCIRLPKPMAMSFFETTPVGTKVIIANEPPVALFQQ